MSVQYTSTMAYVYTNNGFIIIIHPAFSIRDKWKIVSRNIFWFSIVDYEKYKFNVCEYVHYISAVRILISVRIKRSFWTVRKCLRDWLRIKVSLFLYLWMALAEDIRKLNYSNGHENLKENGWTISGGKIEIVWWENIKEEVMTKIETGMLWMIQNCREEECTKINETDL